MITPKSLQQRLALFILLPLTLLLVAMFGTGFFFARDILLKQFQETAILKLQRAAHQIDMRLSGPAELLKLFGDTGGREDGDIIQQTIVERIRNTKGVVRVELVWNEDDPVEDMPVFDEDRLLPGGQGRMRRMGRFHRTRAVEVTPPQIDPLIYDQTVVITSYFEDERGEVVGHIEIVVEFGYLMKTVRTAGWWQIDRAFLVDGDGRVLATAGDAQQRRRLGENGDSLEIATLDALRSAPFGTLTSGERPPREVSGYCRLSQAPWYLVLFAPGEEILAPIIRFRNYYFIVAGCFILLIVLLLRRSTLSTVVAIRNVSAAARRIARGKYGSALAVTTADEVGELTRNFNTMITQLKERERLKKDIDLAKEVQQNLLPESDPEWPGLDVAGRLIYCDETGGDYYDYLDSRQPEVGIVVGDVSGHGISAALLMASLRALLRQRLSMPGEPGAVITDVNRQISRDTSETGDFITLLYLNIDRTGRRLQWVRAGHDPAMVYDPGSDSFLELSDGGPALGFDDTCEYATAVHNELRDRSIVIMGTDGIWETFDPAGEPFGKDRLCQVVRQHQHKSARQILTAVIDALSVFRKQGPIEDDITLVVVKVNP